MTTHFTFKQKCSALRNYMGGFLFSMLCLSSPAQGSWTVVSTAAPDPSGGLMLLLSDGSVLCKTTAGGGDGIGNGWNKLSPDASGSYINGTWSTISPMADTRLYFSSQVLKNGKVYVAGGEYGTGTNLGELYDPATDSWTQLPNTNSYYGDANSKILDDGKVLQASLDFYNKILVYNPATNTYTSGPNSMGGHDESSWVKLPDNSVLFVDIFTVNSERYIPSLNQWVSDATLPVNLYDPYGFETGPAFMLPDGRAFFMGSPGTTAFYTPSGSASSGTWAAGPTIPNNNGMADAPGAMMADGKILFTAAAAPFDTASIYNSPSYFYEFDYLANTYSAVAAPGGGSSVPAPNYVFTMLDLPDGNVMLSQQGFSSYYFYAPSGQPLTAGQPTISAVTQGGCGATYTLTGLLFNGISEGAMYGDDWQMNSNYPIVRLSSGSNVYYARTHDWNHTGLSSGSLADTTLFDLPASIPPGSYSLSVSANGISSLPITFSFAPFPALTSPLTNPAICSGDNFSYSPTVNLANTTLIWTRAGVAGISNPAINTPQTTNPNEALFNTGNTAKTVVYSYTLTNNSCVTYYAVSVVVNPGQVAVQGLTVICENSVTTLTATGGADFYSWSTGDNTNTVIINPSATTVYAVTGSFANGCNVTQQVTVNVKPLPVLNATPNTTICANESIVIGASGDGTSYYWPDLSVTAPTVALFPTSSDTYTVFSFLAGCRNSAVIEVDVDICTDLKSLNTATGRFTIYPNPCHEELWIGSDLNVNESCLIKVYNTFGQAVLEEEAMFQPGQAGKRLDLAGLANGIYLVTIQTKNTGFKAKVIKGD